MNDQTRIDASNATVATQESPPLKPGGARRIRLTFFAVILVVLGFWAWNWISNALVRVHETDARIMADMVALSSRVSGRLIQRDVGAGSVVEKSQILAVIDAAVSQTRLAELHAAFERLNAERDELAARIIMVDARSMSSVLSEQASLEAALARVGALQHETQYAGRELERTKRLLASDVVSARDVDEAQTVFLKAQQSSIGATAGVAIARARLASAESERYEVGLLQAEHTTLAFRQAELSARIERQRIHVADHSLSSPLDGVVSKAFVDVGEFVQAGQRIALMHDPQTIYVEANIRETEIRRVQIGQRVDVEVDAYPDQKFGGVVERIGYAATSAFALLPSPNPSGHFTKVTQRLPIRIALSQRDGRLRPGMMVEVYIDVAD